MFDTLKLWTWIQQFSFCLNITLDNSWINMLHFLHQIFIGITFIALRQTVNLVRWNISSCLGIKWKYINLNLHFDWNALKFANLCQSDNQKRISTAQKKQLFLIKYTNTACYPHSINKEENKKIIFTKSKADIQTVYGKIFICADIRPQIVSVRR